ncbi:MAG: iron-sulfur cluster assembly protein, partial [Rhodospirillaceae bacterium]
MTDTLQTSEQTQEKTRDQLLFDMVVERLRMVFDPEIPVNIYELGLVYSIKTTEEGEVAVEMTL